MANEAHTLTKVGKPDVRGTTKVQVWTLDCTNYNSTSKIVLTAGDLGLKRIRKLSVQVQSRQLDRLVSWNGSATSPLLTLTVADTGAEVATDVDGGVFLVTAEGI